MKGSLMILVTVNRKEFQIPCGTSVSSLVDLLKDSTEYTFISAGNYMVAVNGQMIQYEDQNSFELHSGDNLIIAPECVGG